MTTALEKPDMNTEELLAGQTITPAEEEQNSVQSTSRLSREKSRIYGLARKAKRRKFGA